LPELDKILAKSEFTTEEMVFVVEQYIKKRKNRDIQLTPPNNQMRSIMLVQFFNKAMDWFQSPDNA